MTIETRGTLETRLRRILHVMLSGIMFGSIIRLGGDGIR